MKAFFTAVALAASATLPLVGFSQNAGIKKDGSVSLKFNFKPNSKFSYSSQTVQNIDMQGNKMMQDITMGSTFAVQTGQGSSKDLHMTYSRVAMNMDAGGQKMVYDSQDPATKSSPLAAMMGGMIGKSLDITVTDKGEVTAVKGVEELKKAMLADNPAIGPQLEQTLNENTLKSSMNQLFNIYPDHAVKPGESWTKNVTLNMGPAAMKLASTYKLASVQSGVAHLLVDGKLSMDGMMALTGTQSGTMDIDVATGLVLSSKLKQTLSSPAGDNSTNIASNITTTGKKL
ncbi:MAG: DUF6263 family protein [Janthinobacterium lividum]